MATRQEIRASIGRLFGGGGQGRNALPFSKAQGEIIKKSLEKVYGNSTKSIDIKKRLYYALGLMLHGGEPPFDWYGPQQGYENWDSMLSHGKLLHKPWTQVRVPLMQRVLHHKMSHQERVAQYLLRAVDAPRGRFGHVTKDLLNRVMSNPELLQELAVQHRRLGRKLSIPEAQRLVWGRSHNLSNKGDIYLKHHLNRHREALQALGRTYSYSPMQAGAIAASQHALQQSYAHALQQSYAQTPVHSARMPSYMEMNEPDDIFHNAQENVDNNSSTNAHSQYHKQQQHTSSASAPNRSTSHHKANQRVANGHANREAERLRRAAMAAAAAERRASSVTSQHTTTHQATASAAHQPFASNKRTANRQSTTGLNLDFIPKAWNLYYKRIHNIRGNQEERRWEALAEVIDNILSTRQDLQRKYNVSISDEQIKNLWNSYKAQHNIRDDLLLEATLNTRPDRNRFIESLYHNYKTISGDSILDQSQKKYRLAKLQYEKRAATQNINELKTWYSQNLD